VSAVARESVGALLGRLWREPAAWATTADIFVILIALTLPWSTSLVAIFAVALLVTMLPFLDFAAFLQSLKRPICALPIALFALAVAGTLWSDAPWGARLYAVGPTVKLLMLPALLYHFERSTRGMQVFIAFLVSSVLLLAMSWVVAFAPSLALKSGPNTAFRSKTISIKARNSRCVPWRSPIPSSRFCGREELFRRCC